MATAFVFESDQFSAETYDTVMGQMALGSVDSPFPAGLVAHVAGPHGDAGWRVVDVWESEDAANRFYGSDQFAPVRDGAEAAGIRTTPWSIHRIQIPGPVATIG
jgi:hypothetical protein